MKEIPGFEGRYAITENGKVWSIPRKSRSGRPAIGCWLKQTLGGRQYLSVSLRKDGERMSSSYTVHRLILLAFQGPPSFENAEANHIDGDKLNNHIKNLEWTTSSGNRKHAWENGLIKQTENRKEAAFQRGLKHRKLTASQATDIRLLNCNGMTITALARKYGVSRKAIYMILNRITYAREE